MILMKALSVPFWSNRVRELIMWSRDSHGSLGVPNDLKGV